MSGKRKRDSKFSTLESEFLVECLFEFRDIIENKKTDQSSGQAKKKAWNRIVQMFEDNPDCPTRTVLQLENKWKDLKKLAKGKVGAIKKYRKGTGGGPAPPELPGMIQRIWDMIPAQFERIPNDFDDDASSGAPKAMSATMPEVDDLSDSEESDSEAAKVQIPNFGNRSEISINDDDGQQTKKFCQKIVESTIIQQKPVQQIKCNPDEAKQQIFELTKKTVISEHDSKMELLELKKQAAKEKILAYQAKAEYYRHKHAKKSAADQQISVEYAPRETVSAPVATYPWSNAPIGQEQGALTLFSNMYQM